MQRLFIVFICIILFINIDNFCFSEEKDENLIQLAILLDTSGSMEGLIEQAKAQLWKIVNELALAKRNGLTPNLEVALFEYGKSSIPKNEGYIKMLVPLTSDLDKISEELFKLTTNGGDEYCGYVIKEAIDKLKWSKNNNVLKIIFIAGNEPFTQGEVNYTVSCKKAINNGIIVNTIFCGDYNEGINTNWKDGADIADGKYINIDHNQQIVDIIAPQDDEILKLNTELNETYVYYGYSGKELKGRQEEQDKNASSMNNDAIVQRTITKSKKQYNNASWDLVDAYKEGSVSIDDLKDEELPEEMKKMNDNEKKEYVETQLKKREEIQNKINKLSEERRKYVEKEILKNSENSTLDTAMIKAIREQANKKNYNFK